MRLIERWRARPRRARIADAALASVVLLLAVALVVNSAADVRQSGRARLDQRVLQDYLISFAGGTAPFGHQAYVSVRGGHDLVCAFLRHANGGLCLQVVNTSTKSRKITREYACTNLPPLPTHSPPPRGSHWCPYHAEKVI